MVLRLHSLLLILVSAALISQTLAITRTKFTEWYPKAEADLKPSWTTGDCRDICNAYVQRGQGECGRVLDCTLENTSELRKTTIQAAQVVLVVMPWLLASVRSSVAEISASSTQRPLLTFLLTLGAPTYQTRVFEYTHPLEVLEALPLQVKAIKIPCVLQPLISAIQYTLALAASVNNIELALSIGSKSVMAWACGSWYMPLVWVLFPISTYLVAFVSCSWLNRQQAEEESTSSTHCSMETACRGLFCCCYRCLRISYKMRSMPAKADASPIAIMLQMFGCCLAFVHVTLGALILSSLIFVGFHDTLGILGRFLASALVCRLITLFQLTMFRASLLMKS